MLTCFVELKEVWGKNKISQDEMSGLCLDKTTYIYKNRTKFGAISYVRLVVSTRCVTSTAAA